MENNTTGERVVTINSPELKELILELKAIDTTIADMVKASEDAQEKFNTELMVRQKLVDKMKPLVNAEFAGMLEEFEVLANVTIPEIEDGNNVDVKIVDEVEKFKDAKRKAKETTYAAPEGDVIEEKVA